VRLFETILTAATGQTRSVRVTGSGSAPAKTNRYQQAGANVASLDFEIDREGTFARVPGGR
jgi:hypothetical protein